MASLEAQLQAGSKEYQKIQTDYASAVEQRQRLEAQKTENEAVKKEFGALTPSNQIYKLVGGVLLKQEQVEAKANVDKRLEFIQGEINVELGRVAAIVTDVNIMMGSGRVEATLKELDGKMEKKRQHLVELQTQLQQKQAAE
ncbi:Prefoldin subunit 6 [Microbotryomycetes sp. JL201]|nr:Prefoldin subunit 6 [Microbotryomycetes sp. JL201]